MAQGQDPVFHGPKLDWTQDHKSYDRYIDWQREVQLLLDSIYSATTNAYKSRLVQLWMGRESFPLVKMWEDAGELPRENAGDAGNLPATYFAKLDAFFKPKQNTMMAIRDVWTNFQQGNEELNSWIARISNAVQLANYQDLPEDMNIKDRLVRDILLAGCNSQKAKSRIMKEGPNVLLQPVINILQEEKQATQFEPKQINYVKYDAKKGKKGKKTHGRKPMEASTSNSSSNSKKCYRCGDPFSKEHMEHCKAKNATCRACNKVGHYQKCCKKSGNFPKKGSKRVNVLEETSTSTQFFNEAGVGITLADVNMLSKINPSQALVIEFGCGMKATSIDRKLPLKLDTGSDVNAINRKTFQKLFPDAKLTASSSVLQNFDKTCIRPMGTFTTFLRWKGNVYRCQFEVMDSDITPNVLSRKTIFVMKILKTCFSLEQKETSMDDRSSSHTKENTPSVQRSILKRKKPVTSMQKSPSVATSISKADKRLPSSQAKSKASDSSESVSKRKISSPAPGNKSIDPETVKDVPLTESMIKDVYADIFQGLGKFPGEPYKFKLKPDAVPAKHKPRTVPLSRQAALHAEVQNLIDQDVLEPSTDHTEWVNSFVIVEKKVVMDTSNSHSPNHSQTKKIRLCLDPRDLNEALEREPYYSRSVDELIAKFNGAKFFTIVDMDKGYWQVVLDPESRKYTTMALDIGRFQWKRMPMGTAVASDIFQRKLDSVYIGLPGVTGIADDMVVYGTTESEHDWNLINFCETTRKNGLRLNKSKIQFKKKEVSFFGHTWNTTGISPDPKKVQAIRNMTFPEDKETMHSFLGLINFLNRYSGELAQHTSPLYRLTQKNGHYTVTEEHRSAFQSIKDIFEQKIVLPYFSTELECILQTDASKKGFGAVLIQDEKPVYYASRTLSKAEKNYQNLERECMAAVWGMEKFHYFLYGRHFVLQTDQKPLVSIFKKHMTDVTPRMQRLCIRTWNYDFTPEYLKGKDNVISDALSRVNPQKVQDCDIEEEILAVNILSTSTLQQAEIEELQKATSEDTELQCLKTVISNGWPSTKGSCSDVLKNYWNYRDELWIEDGILMKNHKIVIPNVLKGKYLEKVHAGHQGINSCLQRAREYIFWKGYTNDIKETVEKCGLCQENASSTGIQYRYVSDIPPHPWHTLGSDLFYFKRQDFLVLVDYFSKFPVVRKLPNSTTEAVKKELHAIFLEFGIPFVFRSDNGPCYASEDFKAFLQECRVVHYTSSPHYPQSNGLAEATVKLSKRLIEKAVLQGKPWNALLLQHRITPLSSDIPSPAEILFGRKLRTELSILPSQLLNPRIMQQRECIAKKEGRMFKENAQNASNELPLEVGQNVYHQDPHTKKWHPGVIENTCKEPHSFLVKSSNGAVYRRNRNFLKSRQTEGFVQSSQNPAVKPFQPPEQQSPSNNMVNPVPQASPAVQDTPPSNAVKTNSLIPKTPARSSPARRISSRTTKGCAPERLSYGK